MKLLKYLFNLGAICLTIYAVTASFLIIVEPPADNNLMRVALNVSLDLSMLFIVFLSLITLINFLIERKIEKRKSSKEFITLMLVNLTVFIVTTILCATYYMNTCC